MITVQTQLRAVDSDLLMKCLLMSIQQQFAYHGLRQAYRQNVAMKWQLEVTSHLLACLVVQNNHPTTNFSMPNTFHAILLIEFAAFYTDTSMHAYLYYLRGSYYGVHRTKCASITLVLGLVHILYKYLGYRYCIYCSSVGPHHPPQIFRPVQASTEVCVRTCCHTES